MSDNQELLVCKKDDGWDIIFNKGTESHKTHITALSDLSRYIELWSSEGRKKSDENNLDDPKI